MHEIALTGRSRAGWGPGMGAMKEASVFIDQPNSSDINSSAPSSAWLLLPAYLFMFAVVVDMVVVAIEAESPS
jgi:hypothetical protein